MSTELYRDDSLSVTQFNSGNDTASVRITKKSGYIQLDEETALIVAETLADWLKDRLEKKREVLNDRMKKNRDLRFGLVDTSIKISNLNSDLIGE